MKRLNPPAPPKPPDAFHRFIERRTGLDHRLQGAAFLERMRAEWRKGNGERKAGER